MTSDKRDLKDFSKFPGQINEIKNLYEFPPLYEIDQNGNDRVWAVMIRVIKKPRKKISYSSDSQTWDRGVENEIELKKGYILAKSQHGYEQFPAGTVAQLWTEYGVVGGKISISAPTYIEKYSNIGKADERNPLQAAMIKARALWIKQREKGKRMKDEKNVALQEYEYMYFPMLAHNYADKKKYVDFPAYVQYKLDGLRVVAFMNLSGKRAAKTQPTIDDIVIYTRSKRKFLGLDHIKQELLYILKEFFDRKRNVSAYLDGEFYLHGLTLQEINSARKEKISDKIRKCHIYLFDIFYPEKPGGSISGEAYEERLGWLQEVKECIEDYKLQHIKVVKTYEVVDEKNMRKIYKKAISDGYEGIMIKDKSMKYTTSLTSKTDAILRNKKMLKYKPLFREEYDIVGFTDGAGKNKNTIIWILETKDGKTFHADPKNISLAERKKLFNQAKKNFDELFLRRKMMVEFRNMSLDKIPQMAKAVGFRDD